MNRRINILSVAFGVLLIVLTAGCVSAGVVLVEAGTARSAIILDDKPTNSAALAAEELQWHIEKMSGAKLPIVKITEADKLPSETSRIYVGTSPAAEAEGIKAGDLKLEHYVIKTEGNNLFIVGRDTKSDDSIAENPLNLLNTQPGTLFGVYEFLDRQLGVRWLWPGELGTYVPRRETIEIAPMNLTTGPKLLQRYLRAHRINAYSKNEDAYPIGDTGVVIPYIVKDRKDRKEIVRDESLWLRRHRIGRRYNIPFGHSFHDWWDKYHKDHPDYFAKRPKSHKPIPSTNKKLCVSNPAVIRQIIENWKASGAKHLRAIPNDGKGFCTCPNCMAMGYHLPATQEASAPGHKLISDRYAKFWSVLAKEVKKVDPEALVTGYGYSSYKIPPRATKVEDNVVVAVVGGKGLGEFKDPNSDNYIYKIWQGWSDTGAKLFFRPNWLHTGHFAPYMLLHEYGRFIRFAHDHGLVGTNITSLESEFATKAPLLYLFARLQDRPDLTTDEIIAEFASGFGAAAPAITEYISYWEKLTYEMDEVHLKDKRGTGLRSYIATISVIFTDEVLGEAGGFLDKAQGMLADDAVEELQRVEFLRNGLRHLELTGDVVRYATDPATWKDINLINRYIDAAQALKEFRHQHGKDHLLFEYYIMVEYVMGDYTGQRMLQVLGDSKPLSVLPTWWRIQDIKGIGESEKWFAEEFEPTEENGWQKYFAYEVWERSYLKNRRGFIGWHRTNFRVPAEAKDKSVSLLFASSLGDTTVWVNGKLVGRREYPMPKGGNFQWDTIFKMDISDFIRPDEENSVTVKAEFRSKLGGLRRPVFLVTNTK